MRLLTVEETAEKIGFVAFGPGTEYGTPAIQQAAEEAVRVVLRDVHLCHEQEDVVAGPEPGTTRVALTLSLHGVMNKLLLLMGEGVTVSLGYVAGEHGTLAVVNVEDRDGRDFMLSALGVGHLPLLRVLLHDLETSELGEDIDRSERRTE